MTERDNALNIIFKRADPQWVPHTKTCCDFLIPTEVIAERPPLGTTGYDWFGCHWTFDLATFGFVQTPSIKPPVSDICKWKEQVKFPDLSSIDWESGARKILEGTNREERLTKLMIESGVFERMHALLGFEETIYAMYEEPEAFLEMIDAIADFKVEVMNYTAKYFKPDIIMNNDDYATQTGLMMSSEMFGRFIKPAALKVGKAITDNGIIYEHHSCGKIDYMVEDILDMGAIMINALSPINDMDMVLEKYGHRFTVEGGLDTQKKIDYPGITEEDIRTEVRRAIDKIAPYKNYIVNGCSWSMEKEAIIVDETKKYGSYLIGRDYSN